MQVKEAMIPRPGLITTLPSTTLYDAIKTMVVNKIGSMIIEDETDTITGIVTSRDIFQTLVVDREEGFDRPLSDIMALKLLTVNENDLLTTAVMKMEEYGLHHILVKDNDGVVCGILSSFDIVRETSLSSLRI